VNLSLGSFFRQTVTKSLASSDTPIPLLNLISSSICISQCLPPSRSLVQTRFRMVLFRKVARMLVRRCSRHRFYCYSFFF
jgi:hypothetical protein